MPGPAAAQPAGYAVAITGVEDGGLRRLLDATSTLEQLKDEPAPGPAGLRRRIDGDRERLDAALRSEGYYDGRIDITVGQGAGDDTQGPRTRVTIAVTPGPVTLFRRIGMTTGSGAAAPGWTAPDAAALGLAPGTPARGPAVVEAEGRIKDSLGRAGFAFAKVPERRAAIDRADHAMDVDFRIEPGPLVRLGAVHVSGLERVDEALVRGRVAWTPGERYSPELIERTRAGLVKLGVFTSARLQIAETPDADGSHAVTVTVTERKRHYIGLGASFTNSEGVGGQAYWGHRNLFGGGEQLRVAAELSRLNPKTLNPDGLDKADEKLTTELRKPDFLAVDQDLVLATAGINEHPQAYQREALTAQARLENRIAPHLTLGYGVAGEQSNIRDTQRFTTATLVGTPLTATWDGTDSPLDPTRGVRVAFESTPWLRIGDTGHSFLVNRLTPSVYHDLSDDGRLVAAGRLSIGSILNGATADLPADKRFYAGGGGSVRGYAYQKVGPVNAAGDPLGGQALAEAGAELRIRVTEDLGLVPFIDGGNVYSSTLPQPGQTLRFGTGLGVRYYTGFGPLRLDVGMPLQARRTDEAYQVYLSLGQAF